MVMWAQRPNLVFLTVCLEDCKSPEIDVKPDKLHFKGVGGTEKKEHEVTIEFYKEIDPEVRAKKDVKQSNSRQRVFPFVEIQVRGP